jgi:hypothetical protein
MRHELTARWPDAYDHEPEQSLLSGLSTAKTSATHSRWNPSSDNDPLSLTRAIAFRAARPTPPCELPWLHV